jgi:hypothetical protein
MRLSPCRKASALAALYDQCFTTRRQNGDQTPFRICERANLRVAPSARAANRHIERAAVLRLNIMAGRRIAVASFPNQSKRISEQSANIPYAQKVYREANVHDRAYDSDALDEELRSHGTERIARIVQIG